MVGPTGGYLVGFIVGAFTIGMMTEVKKKNGFLWLLMCMMVGTTIIYTFGVIQLMNWMKIDLVTAVFMGVLPFMAGDLLKMLVATLTIHRIRRRLPEFTQPRGLIHHTYGICIENHGLLRFFSPINGEYVFRINGDTRAPLIRLQGSSLNVYSKGFLSLKAG